MRRRIVLAALLLSALGVAWVLSWLTKPFPVRAYERIRLGMTQAEVEEAIGMPAGDYSARFVSYRAWPRYNKKCTRSAGLPFEQTKWLRLRDQLQLEPVADLELRFVVWIWDDDEIWVLFQNGKVAGHYLLETDDRPSILDRLRRFVGL